VSCDWRGSESTIRYGLTPAYDATVNAGAPAPMPWSSPGPFWEARLSGLLPDTLYHYSIGGGPDHTFRTARRPGASDFTVMAEGDIGSVADYWRVGVVQQQVADQHPALTLMIGDLTYGNDHGQVEVDNHYNDVMVWSQDAAYMPAWGNHEWDSSGDDLRNYKGRFDLPNAMTSPGSPAISCCGKDWYWFDYGNVRFIAYPEPWSGAWADWFPRASAIMDSAQANPNIDFIVTFGHRPAYSSGHHAGSSELEGYLDQLGLAHSKYQLNLNGHSHNYERTWSQSGVVHITAGGGGSSMEEDPSGSCLYAGGCPPPPFSAFRAFHHGAVKLSFSASAIKVQAICGPPGDSGTNLNDVVCTQGSVFDSVTISPDAPHGHIDSPLADVAIAPGQSLSWTGTASDPDNDLPLQYLWDFGGGAANSTQEDPGPVVFSTPGVYRVRFMVTDASGETDLSPDTRTITVGSGTTNRPPSGVIVSPAGNVTIQQGQSVSFAGSASDPDGDTALTYLWIFDEAGPNNTALNPGSVTFNQSGTFFVQFTVTDSHGLSDPTPAQVAVTVFATTNQAPNAQLTLSPATGNAPLAIGLNGSGSSDPDGSIASYRFDFGDGTSVGPGNMASVWHTYVAGNWSARLTVTDNRGATRTTSAPIIVASVTPGTNLVGNSSVETDLTGWAGYAGGNLRRLPGGFDRAYAMWVTGPASTATFGVNDSPNWIAQVPSANVGVPYRFSAWVRSPRNSGIAQLQVREFYNGSSQGAATSPGQALATTWQLLSLDYSPRRKGSTLDLQVLDAPVAAAETLVVDNVTIKPASASTGVDPFAGLGGLAAAFRPNPMTGGGEVLFTLPEAGRASVQILDLSGRGVRTLLAPGELAAGEHRVAFDGRAASGERLSSGIYFYRVKTPAGAVIHRFAIVK